MTTKRLTINTMGTGCWYAVLDDKDIEVGKLFIPDIEVCSLLDYRHSEDPSYEGPWQESVEDEYKQAYKDISLLWANSTDWEAE